MITGDFITVPGMNCPAIDRPLNPGAFSHYPRKFGDQVWRPELI
jgi:hypothetical protein